MKQTHSGLHFGNRTFKVSYMNQETIFNYAEQNKDGQRDTQREVKNHVPIPIKA